MSVLTKYRPKKLEEVIGQDSACRALARAITKGTNRTFLLTGPTGVGKTTMARIAASMAKCHPVDIIEVDAASNTGIDDMRNTAEIMLLSPMMDDNRAVIVDEAHALSKQAITSLLKVLEDPPEWGYWFLCTTEPTKIPANIRSRCLHLNLKPVAEDELFNLVNSVATQEKIKFKFKGAVQLCAREAQGSPRQALANLTAIADARSADEAAELLQSAGENPQAFDLAKKLFNGCTWKECQAMLREMKGLNGESVRQVVRAYMTSVALSIPGGPKLQQALAVLEAFEQPCNPMDGITPIVMSCARLLN